MNKRQWLALSAIYLYSICLAFAVSNDWWWDEDLFTLQRFLDSWRVATTQLVVVGVPFWVFALVITNMALSEIATLINDH